VGEGGWGQQVLGREVVCGGRQGDNRGDHTWTASTSVSRAASRRTYVPPPLLRQDSPASADDMRALRLIGSRRNAGLAGRDAAAASWRRRKEARIVSARGREGWRGEEGRRAERGVERVPERGRRE
jgi:hypothetical protein